MLEALVKTLASYEVVTPTRVNEFGDVFPQNRHFSRKKRSSGVPEPPPLRTHYRISAYGQLFQLNLSADSAFLAAGYTEVHLGTPVPGPGGRSTEPPDLRHCFYRGQVNAREDHTAVFSLCGGLMGTFKANDGEYFLEPVLKADGSEHEDDHNKPHLIYRQELKRNTFAQSQGPCEVSENQMEKTALPSPGFRNTTGNVNIKEEAVFRLEGEQSQLHSRNKRFLSYPRYVEVMVTADAKMVHHHGQNLQHYVLTLMSIVAAIYKDSSIGNLINIVIVKLVVIHSEQEGPVISFNAATTLRNFCLWQQSQNVPDDAHPAHHDTAVLITREDICGAKEKCDTLGLAELGTLCDPSRSCSISEENGLSAAFTIAHELGHVFNVPHDDSFKCKEAGVKHQYHVMAPTLNYHTSPWTWSACSQKHITEFLDTGHGECLLDKPSGRTYDLSPQLPGSVYDGNKQCELMFGPGSQVCPYLKQCRRLWCTSAEGVHKGCRTQHMPLADGTSCGPGMHCRRGLCVTRDMETRPVDGEWGPWGPYSSCSRTCGGGIKSTVRLCDRPEAGVAIKDRCKLYCRVAGTTSFYQLKDRVADGTPCGTETNDICVQGLCRQAGCDHVLNSKAKRDKCGVCGGDNSSCQTQAGVFNSAHYGYNVVVKIPAGATNIEILQHSYSGRPEDDNYLALSDTQGNFLLNGNFVVSMAKKEINIQGAVFEYSGSNNSIERINSTDRLDAELVLQRSNLFSWDPYGPWQDCTKMCQGLHRRKIVCIRKSDHAVVSDQSCSHLPLPPLVTEKCNTDCELRWHITGKSDCSSRCGQGYRTLDVHCLKYSVHKGQTVPVGDQFCSDQHKPPSREPCHSSCVLTRWHYSEWSQCSRSCGGGERTRESYCINGFGHRLAEGECRELPRAVLENCNEFPCPSWATSEWSECPVTCGKGMKQRQVWCQQSEDPVRDGFCNASTKPESLRPCELPACASWHVGPWGSCTATCGHGYQMRAVKCVSEIFGTMLDDRECPQASRPSDRQDCIFAPCLAIPKVLATSLPAIPLGKAAQWRHGSWTPCSVSCGRGHQARYVSCRDAHDEVADESNCAHLPRPAAASLCFSPCGEWQAGDWSPCSASCGRGKTTRRVLCVNYHQLVDESYCDPEGRPVTAQECSLAACPPSHGSSEKPSHVPGRNVPLTHKPGENQDQGVQLSIRGNQWRTGPWGACSRSCAGGLQHRAVVCQDEDGQSATSCDAASKPPESKHCGSGPCPHWNYGDWGECTQTCGGGVKSRFVICQFPNGQMTQEHSCELPKPPSMMQCHLHACPDDVSWYRGPWKSVLGNISVPAPYEMCAALQHSLNCHMCSASCGKGIKYRDVLCIDQFQRKLEEKYCSHLHKPRTHKACRSGRCPSWKANKWKECSVTCGSGVQQREVYCRLRGTGPVAEGMCDPSTQPQGRRQCWRQDCMRYHWTTGDWLDCSTSCKKKETYRLVKCTNEQNIQVNESLCDPLTRPLSVKKCRNPHCQYMVVTGDLSQCAGNCGFTSPQKITYCTRIRSSKKHGFHQLRPAVYGECPVIPSPQVYKCDLRSCLHVATWKVGKWSKCSVTCGNGITERRVACRTENGWPSDLCLKRLKPDAQKKCHASDCKLLTTCKEIQVANNVTKDGDYDLNVRGRMLKIHCSGMQLENPREYLPLVKTEDNFSEIYGLRLQNPYECPFNGSRRPDCACTNDYQPAGYTVFSKVRVDLESMQIKTTDLLFSQTLFGKAVPFATAGDCYSAAKCPQGQFSINLAGTGIKISSTAKWLAQGRHASVIIHRSQDGTKVYGRCGGFCGKCIPHMATGLPIQVL
ncbi:A disintegrin and metalloproteinase with thrombospondin motifs 20 [Apodemus speciosus]|uniref:A disintegrin and metalloproteinase with thrombospondin motifs 20 n=1 Tax=Apodemus speciosus TaxID=105296 RepID=A0ABQ0FKJ4_APOSI